MTKTFYKKATKKMDQLINKSLKTKDRFNFYAECLGEIETSFKSFTLNDCAVFLKKEKRIWAEVASEVLRKNKMSKTAFYDL
jgi:hypothetical protein